MIERHITLNVHPDMTTELERLFIEEYRPAAASMPGLIECSLLREAEHADRYQIVFRWKEAEQAVAWRVSDIHEALQPPLRALLASMEITAYTKVA